MQHGQAYCTRQFKVNETMFKFKFVYKDRDKLMKFANDFINRSHHFMSGDDELRLQIAHRVVTNKTTFPVKKLLQLTQLSEVENLIRCNQEQSCFC